MYSNRFRALAIVMGILFAGNCVAQDLELTFDGSCGSDITGDAGSVQSTSLDCVLTTSNNPTEGGVQAWSISVAAEGATITNITTDGTAGAEVDEGGLRNVGFEKSETTDDSGIAAGGNNNCEGLSGAVSAVVLSFESPVTLEVEGSAVVARVDIEAGAPDGPGDCSTVSVFYADGCRGAGQPVRNSVTLNTATFIPEVGRCSFDVCAAQVEDCGSEGDEDGNGLADCDDPACAENAACVDDGGNDGGDDNVDNGGDDDGDDGDDDGAGGDDGDGDDGGDDGNGDNGGEGDDGDEAEEEEGENAPPGFAFGRSGLSPPEDAENEDASGSVKLVQVRSRASMHIHVSGLEPGAAYNVNATLDGASEDIGTITTREASVRPSRCYSGGLSVPEEEDPVDAPAEEAPAEEAVEGGGAGEEEGDGGDDAEEDGDAEEEGEADDDDEDDDRHGWRWGWRWGCHRRGHGRREREPSGSARINLNRSLTEASYRVTVRRLPGSITSVRLILNDGTIVELEDRRGRIELAEGQAETLNGAVFEVYTAEDEDAEASLALTGDVNSCYPRLDRRRARIAARRAGKGSLRLDTRRDDELPLGATVATDLEGAEITITSEDGTVVLIGTIDELRTFGRNNEDDNEEAVEVVEEIAEEGGGAAFKLLEPHDASFVRGDANDDGVVNLSDPIRILSMLFQGGGNLYCDDSADANDDGTINLTDPILILQTLFDGNVGGISAPYPYRGFDPTSDDMHCKDFEG